MRYCKQTNKQTIKQGPQIIHILLFNILTVLFVDTGFNEMLSDSHCKCAVTKRGSHCKCAVPTRGSHCKCAVTKRGSYCKCAVPTRGSSFNQIETSTRPRKKDKRVKKILITKLALKGAFRVVSIKNYREFLSS